MIDFQAEAQHIADDIIAFRRDFHQHPELRFAEHRTGQIIAEELNRLGLEVQTGIGETGVVGILEGAQEGQTLLYRTDMDALPIQELNDISYKSLYDGKMHACGHDGHMAIALGLARVFAKHRDKIKGRIKFVFQPAEEGAGGALAMIKDGILDDPEPDVALGLHLWNPLPIGKLGVAKGAMMSGSSVFEIQIQGKSGHAAMPHTTIDPVACAGQLVTALHTIVGRRMNAMDGAVVLSVTGINTSSYTHNVIPETVNIIGTFRTFNAYTSELLEQHVRDVAHSVSESVGCHAQTTVRHLSIPTVNDEEVINHVCRSFLRIADKKAFVLNERTMASEDISYILDDIPGMYLLLGSSNAEKGLTYGHHSPYFNFDEDVLPLGVALMSSAIADYVMPNEVESVKAEPLDDEIPDWLREEE